MRDRASGLSRITLCSIRATLKNIFNLVRVLLHTLAYYFKEANSGGDRYV